MVPCSCSTYIDINFFSYVNGSNNNTKERLIHNLQWKQETMVHNKHSILNTWPKKKIEQKLGFYHIILQAMIKNKKSTNYVIKTLFVGLGYCV
jgi:hypothetical protein